MKKLTLKSDERGSLLLVFIAVIPFLIMMAIYFTQVSLTSYQVARLDQLHSAAQLAADAGADYAVEQFSQDSTWSSTSGEVTLHNDSKYKTTYQASISGDSSAKVVSVIGRTYWPKTTTTPIRQVKIYVDLKPVTGGDFSVVSGTGGLLMSNSAKIVGGDVFVNGEISMENSSQIGLSTKSLKVDVANQRCPSPADSTYPRVCNSGENGQPITISGTQARIYGTVTATGQTSGASMSNPGLVGGTVTPKSLPAYDRAAQKAAVATTISGSTASCSGSQTKTWAANTKITGNVTVSNNCKVTVEGNVWITGTLSLTNSSQLIVSNTLGSTRPVIMVDGSTGVDLGNTSSLVPNSSSTGFEIITFYSAASCSPDCVSVTGTDLASSRTINTITLNNSGSNPKTILYAYWSQIEIKNSGEIGAVIGQTVKLTNTGTITFGSSAGVSDTTWVIKGYRRQ